MVVREDGTKWACHSCLKGHRVSGCTHIDRELVLVPKKGRPVTQCQHCRVERKKRSAHVKCDCGEDGKQHHPKEKCIHLREAEERQKTQGFRDDIREDHDLEHDDHGHLAAVAEEQTCCCSHGGKCICSMLKKEVSAPSRTNSNDATPPYGQPAVQKPKLDTTRSEGHLTIFHNGHHKPVHRKNNAAHESGTPYKLPLQRSHTDSAARVARRSVDSLPLDSSGAYNPSSNLPPTSVPYPTGRRMSKSEQTSPRLNPMGSQASMPFAMFSSQDLGGLSLGAPTSGTGSPTGDSAFAFPSLEPASSVADSHYDPWSTYPSSDMTSFPNASPFAAWPPSSDIGYLAQPALTAASSGTQSETEDLPPVNDYGLNYSVAQDRLQGFPPLQANSSPVEQPDNRRSLPPDFFSNFALGNNRVNSEASQYVNGMAGIAEDQLKDTMRGGQTHQLDNSWKPQNVFKAPPQRRTTNSSLGSGNSFPHVTGRPPSQSVGAARAPNDDLIRELFGDIDCNSSTSAQNGNVPRSDPGFSPMTTNDMNNNDMSAYDTTANFVAQPWAEGSMIMPDGSINVQYDFCENFELDPTIDWSR